MPEPRADDASRSSCGRVLMLTPFASPNRGGVETHIDALIAALARRDIRVTLLTHQPLIAPVKAPAREPLPNGEVIRIPWFGQGWHPRIEPYAPLVFAYLVPGLLAGAIRHRLTHKSGFDVIHAHGLAAAVAALGMRWTGARQPIVVSIHAIYGLRERPLLAKAVRLLLRRVDRVLAVSEALQQELLDIGLDPDRVVVFQHWVDLEVFRPRDQAKARTQLGWPQAVPTCLFVGRMLRKKGIGIVLDLAQRLPNVQFRMLGAEGDMESAVTNAAAASLNLTLMRDPSGQAAERLDTIATMYAAADLVLVPSQYEEAAGIVVLEGSAAGTPIVASNLGGLQEAVTSEIGRLVEPSVEAFAEALESMLHDRQGLAALSKRTRASAERRFSERNVDLIVRQFGFEADSSRR